jgi:cytochrome c biogenesis protein CcmG, thiol:disulfide interchange protein DsbE
MHGSETRRPGTARRLTLAIAVIGAIALAGCSGGGGGSVSAGKAPRISTAGIPRPLARNIKQANVILDGRGDLLKQKLRALRGYPVVVNQWASWCDPCRFEFPFFQSAARRHASEVAFLGIDMQDTKSGGKKFLKSIPSLFPSIFDPDASYIGSLGGGRVSPTTVFLDRKGKVVHVSQGAYASLARLEDDIRLYAKPKQS